jgi:phage gp46-like protein
LNGSFPVFSLGWTIGGGARASRVRVRASRPNHRWTNLLVEGFSARRQKRQPGRSRSPFKTLPRRSNSPRRNAVKTGAKTGALRIPHSAFRTGNALFRYSFWDGRLGGARASRVQVRASRPNHRWTNLLVEGFSARRRKRQPGRSRSPFPNAALLAASKQIAAS